MSPGWQNCPQLRSTALDPHHFGEKEEGTRNKTTIPWLKAMGEFCLNSDRSRVLGNFPGKETKGKQGREVSRSGPHGQTFRFRMTITGYVCLSPTPKADDANPSQGSFPPSQEFFQNSQHRAPGSHHSSVQKAKSKIGYPLRVRIFS